MAACKQLVSMAIDTEHHSLFSGNRSGVMAISDFQAGRVVTRLPVGMGVDGEGYDPFSGNAFASNADGTLTVIHQDSPDKYRIAQTIETPRGISQHGPKSHLVNACMSLGRGSDSRVLRN
jgi:hypothetical protein